MKLKEALKKLRKKDVIGIAQSIAKQEGIAWNDGICFVFNAILDNPDRTPNMGTASDSEMGAIGKWVKKYKKAFDGRVSVRTSNPPGTVIDPILEKIIRARLSDLTNDDLNRIKFAHRLEMSAENILGLFLEEYLSINLKPVGWHCAWGDTVKSVDFVHENGELLQIKNRDNSENSSSSTVRDGTTIQKWFRIKSARVEYMWDSLNEICGTQKLSEDDFVKFVVNCVKKNPDSLAVEDDNPWKEAE